MPTGLHTLIRTSAGGDEQAQVDLYALVSKPLFQYILNRFGPTLNEEDAREIIQHTVVQMYIHADRFAGVHNEASAWQWAYKIARNQALKWIKTFCRTVPVWETASQDDHAKDEEALFDAIVLAYAPISPEDALEEQVLNQVIWETARHCLEELNEREREIVILRYAQNCTLEEIAQKYSIKRPRVHQVLAVIHHKLRKAAKLDEPRYR